MWESMSPPFFSNPSHTVGVIFFIGAACPFGRSAAFFLTRVKRTGEAKPCSNERVFLFYTVFEFYRKAQMFCFKLREGWERLPRNPDSPVSFF
jgi:hypothetical protein